MNNITLKIKKKKEKNKVMNLMDAHLNLKLIRLNNI